MCSALFVIKGEMYLRCELTGMSSGLANKTDAETATSKGVRSQSS